MISPAQFLSLIIATSLASMSVSAAEPAMIGKWTLNLAKSKFVAGHAPKSEIRTYSQSPEGIVVNSVEVDEKGSEKTTSFTFKEDGKPYPVTDDPEVDSAAIETIDARHWRATEMKGGKVVATLTRTVSGDGNTLTMSVKGTDANGKKYSYVAVYDRD